MSADPRSWMLFVDGENLTIRGEKFAQDSNIPLTEGEFYRKGVFVWLPDKTPRSVFYGSGSYLAHMGQRAYYYTSVKADDTKIERTKQQLWDLEFTPQVFKKVRKEDKAKGVDIGMTKDMLSHAFQNHYEAACLLAGDGDYVPLVEELKRVGKIVVCVFFENYGLSPDLKLACDEFVDLSENFREAWQVFERRKPK